MKLVIIFSLFFVSTANASKSPNKQIKTKQSNKKNT